MIKVIETKEPLYRVECLCCKSLLGFDRHDIKHSINEYHGELYINEYLNCPICKKKIILKTNERYIKKIMVKGDIE